VKEEATRLTGLQPELTALRNRPELYAAYIAAHWFRLGGQRHHADAPTYYDAACQLVEICRKHYPRFLELFADALKGDSRFQPSDTRRRLIESYAEAWVAKAKRASTGIILELENNRPKPREWRAQFAESYPHEPMPDERTFRRTMDELRLRKRRQKPDKKRHS
jgi:hypothetical protein